MFNGTYTVENKETGESRTFSVKTQAADAKFAPGKRVVALLSGPDNESDYTGFGFLEADRIVVWNKKRGQPGKPSHYEIYASLLFSLVNEGEASRFVKKYRVLSSCTCIRCNRKLTTPESIKSGIGPECAAELGFDRAALAEAFDHAQSTHDEPTPPKLRVSNDDSNYAAIVREEAAVAASKKPVDLWDFAR